MALCRAAIYSTEEGVELCCFQHIELWAFVVLCTWESIEQLFGRAVSSLETEYPSLWKFLWRRPGIWTEY